MRKKLKAKMKGSLKNGKLPISATSLPFLFVLLLYFLKRCSLLLLLLNMGIN